MVRDEYSELLPIHGAELSGSNGTWRVRYLSAREWPQGLDYHFRLERRDCDSHMTRDVWILVSRARLESEAGLAERTYLKAIAEKIRHAIRTGASELDCRHLGEATGTSAGATASPSLPASARAAGTPH